MYGKLTVYEEVISHRHLLIGEQGRIGAVARPAVLYLHPHTFALEHLHWSCKTHSRNPRHLSLLTFLVVVPLHEEISHSFVTLKVACSLDLETANPERCAALSDCIPASIIQLEFIEDFLLIHEVERIGTFEVIS
jgi:hypothetical protein